MKTKWIFVAIVCLSQSLWAATVPAGWQQIKPGGETLCARGAEFSFLVRPGDPKKILIGFGGGGACWDDLTCDSDRVYLRTAEASFHHVAAGGGVFDFKNPQNPYRGWTYVFIPYCTGDIHVGSSDTTYTRPDRSTFVAHHRGAANSKAVLKWVKDKYAAPTDVSVVGASAGSYGSIAWTPTVAEAYPKAHIVQFGDSGAGVADTVFLPQWSVDKSLPTWIPALDPRVVDWSCLSMVDVYVAIANYYPNIRFSQFNFHQDRIQTLFYAAMGGAGFDWSKRMFSNMDSTAKLAPNFRYYVAPGKDHTVLNKSRLYTTTVDGLPLSEWLRKEVHGEDVENVKCIDCTGKVK